MGQNASWNADVSRYETLPLAIRQDIHLYSNLDTEIEANGDIWPTSIFIWLVGALYPFDCLYQFNESIYCKIFCDRWEGGTSQSNGSR